MPRKRPHHSLPNTQGQWGDVLLSYTAPRTALPLELATCGQTITNVLAVGKRGEWRSLNKRFWAALTEPKLLGFLQASLAGDPSKNPADSLTRWYKRI